MFSQLLYSFYGLLRLGELVVPDNPKLRVHGELLYARPYLLPTHYSFVLYSHKTDVNFESSMNAIQQVAEADPNGHFSTTSSP
ncbi:hypothetical protein AZE42_11633 [Rhizopogon vesiculosus]|uniref:Uncharacterized protein n=1 Tax=Rhizopogon vesiculosus TaxID=180088 RepID=A0A1J8PMX8_9AGAM|nr:hypothetical protein AZE42_11633 [Rhizopogon vesiculosus]